MKDKPPFSGSTPTNIPASIPTSMVQSFDNFESASREALSYLRNIIPFDLWMMTRVDGDSWIVLQTEDHGYDIAEGTVIQWADSFCSRMVQGFGPIIAPNANNVQAYASAPIAQQVSIGAYVGVPIIYDDGSLFGTLCGIDPELKNDELLDKQPLVEMLASLLSTILNNDLRVLELQRTMETIQYQAQTDPLTGLMNRRGWNETLAKEEIRARRYGSPVCIFILDLDELKIINDTKGHDAGDKVLRRTARCLQQAVRQNDVVARLGGDEFAVLALECNAESAESVLLNIRYALREEGVEASIGFGSFNPLGSLDEATNIADLAMYADKEHRRKSTSRWLS